MNATQSLVYTKRGSLASILALVAIIGAGVMAWDDYSFWRAHRDHPGASGKWIALELFVAGLGAGVLYVVKDVAALRAKIDALHGKGTAGDPEE